MPTRGRGRGRGSNTINSRQAAQSSINPLLQDPILDSSGGTSTNGLSPDGGQLAGGGQSSSANRLINGSQSNVDPTSPPHRTVDRSSVDSHHEVDRRPVISVQKKVMKPRRFVPESSVTRDIISELLMRMPEPAANWSSYPAEMKDILFNNFMEKYRFESVYDRSMARTVWNLTCMDRYSDSLARAREKAKAVTKSNNPADYKGHGPKGIRAEIWDGLCDIWATPEWLKKSAAAKNNRASKPECMVHTGGSKSFGQHLRDMEAEHKRPVSYNELYTKVHKKKDGDYVSNKAKNFIETYETGIVEKYGEDASKHPTVDSEVWIKAAGENSKGRVHGTGHSLEITISNSPHGSSTTVGGPYSTNSPSTDIVAIFTQMSQMQEQMSEMREQMQTQLQIQSQSQMQQVHTQLQTQIQVQMEAQMKAQEEMKAELKAEMRADLKEAMQAQMQAQLDFFRTEILPALQKK